MPSGMGAVGFGPGLRLAKDVAVGGVFCVFGFDDAECWRDLSCCSNRSVV